MRAILNPRSLPDVVLAPDGQVASANTSYVTLFHGYILRSLSALQTLMTQAGGELVASEREQAWLFLDYGLKVPQAWPLVRDLLLTLAPQMERAGFRDEWCIYLARGIVAAQQAHDTLMQAHLWLHIGRIYRLRSDFPQAKHAFEEAVTHAQFVQDRRLQAMAHNQLAYLARLQSDYSDAKAGVEAALEQLDDDDLERATSYSWLGAIAYDQMDWDQATRYYQKALAIWQSAEDQQRAAWSLQNLGNTLRNAKRHAEAADYIRQAIVILGKVDDPVNQAIARLGLGSVYEELGRANEALALYSLAEPVFRQVRDDLHLAMVHNNQAVAYRALGQWSAAKQACAACIRLWEVLGEVRFLANSLDELGLACIGEGHYSEAIAAFERGLTLLESIESGPFRDMVYQTLMSHLREANDLVSKARGASSELDAPLPFN